jgi:hypothetical protein
MIGAILGSGQNGSGDEIWLARIEKATGNKLHVIWLSEAQGEPFRFEEGVKEVMNKSMWDPAFIADIDAEIDDKGDYHLTEKGKATYADCQDRLVHSVSNHRRRTSENSPAKTTPKER